MLKSLCKVMVGADELSSWWMYAGLAGLYMTFDVAYYLRGVYTAVAWTFISRLTDSVKSRNAQVLQSNLLSPSLTCGICWFTDLDLMFHMNNARYLRECDFARYKFLISCGLGPALRRTGYTMVLGASTIRYRRSIGLFDRFTVATRVLAWDDKSLYIEHKFHRDADGFICAIVMVKQSLVTGTIDALFDAALSSKSVVGKRLAEGGAISLAGREGLVSPAFPEELVKWLESNNISSQKLNPQRPADKSEIMSDKPARREPSPRVEKKETKNPEIWPRNVSPSFTRCRLVVSKKKMLAPLT